jgi:hypothetical protein
MKQLLLICACVLLACQSTPPTTEILVVVDSDLQELSQLHVEIRQRDGAQLLAEQEVPVSSLPLSFSLYPLGDAQSLRLVIVGRDARGADLVEQQLFATFLAERRAVLEVFLRRSCLGNLCRDASGNRTDRTCTFGACEPTSEAPLHPAGDGPLGGYHFDAGTSELPTGSKVDATAPVEAGPVAACTVDGDCAAKLGTVEPKDCALARCVDGNCVFEVADADGDGDRKRVCRASGAELALGMDCDDANRAISSREWDGPAGKDGDSQRADRCDQLDNDCNGKTDDARLGGASCACDPKTDVDVACSQRVDGTDIVWPAGAPVGGCRAGKRSCIDGAWTACVGAVTPVANDSCTTPNDDSNCNGVLGENCQCTDGATRPCGVDTGSCQAGVQTCVSGRWASECVGAVTAAATDTCEPNNDDNCNGSANDGCKCINGTVSTCGEVLPTLGDCLARSVTCTDGLWPAFTCTAQCNDCPANDPCAPGFCLDGQATFSCDCPPGTTGNGTKSCAPINDCPADDPCAPGECDDGANDFSCVCPPLYDGDGTHACTPSFKICEAPGGGMDGGTAVRCGPHTKCGGDDGGFGCICESEEYVPIPYSDPPACKLQD